MIPISSAPVLPSSVFHENTRIFNALLNVVEDELYLFSMPSMKLVYANASVLNNTKLDLATLQLQPLLALLGVDSNAIKVHLDLYRRSDFFLRLIQNQAPTIGIVQHDNLRVRFLNVDGDEFIFLIKNASLAMPSLPSNVRENSANQMLMDTEARVEAIISNAPGLVFELELDAEGNVAFTYLSGGCKALLGLDASELMRESQLFFSMMNHKDQASLRKHLNSVELVLPVDWEGRVWVNAWQDNKWINLRATPRMLGDARVQWVGIMINITQSKKEKHELQESRRELAQLTAHMNQIKELERTKIAREVHDDLGGNLTAIKIGLASITNRLNAGQTVAVDQAKRLESIVDSTFEAIHKISSDLRPNILDLGIVAALKWQAKQFEKQLGIKCTFATNPADITVNPDQAITLFRICQESMSNIAKHAHASNVHVDLKQQNDEIMMKISDNGVGINSIDTYKLNSFGLRGMQERVAALCGSFDIDQLPEQGTVVTVILPIE